jgi:flagellin-like hook-associated protein FlgL
MVIIANSATNSLFITDYHRAASGLQSSMNRLASGERLGLGEAPADLGISERFRAQILNSEEAGRVIQNAVNMFTSSDGWLQEVQNMLDRMGQLAVSASDSSKNDGDRANLNFEFQELKDEISRVAQAGKYNGLAINSTTSISTYDFNTNRIVYRQSDGSDERVLPFDFKPGSISANGLEYGLVNTSGDNEDYVADFIFSDDGKYLYWMNQIKADATKPSSGVRVNKLELETGFMTQTAVLSSLKQEDNFRNMNQLVMGEDGELWVSVATGTASTTDGDYNFKVGLINQSTMAVDFGGLSTSSWSGTSGDLAEGFGEFAVYQDEIYYVKDNPFSQTNPKQITTASTHFPDKSLQYSDVLYKGEYELWAGTNSAGAKTGALAKYKSTGTTGVNKSGIESEKFTLATIQNIKGTSNNFVFTTGTTGGATMANAFKYKLKLDDLSIWSNVISTVSGDSDYALKTGTMGVAAKNQFYLYTKKIADTSWDFNENWTVTAANQIKINNTAAGATSGATKKSDFTGREFKLVFRGMEQAKTVSLGYDVGKTAHTGGTALAKLGGDYLVIENLRDRYSLVKQDIFNNQSTDVLIEDFYIPNTSVSVANNPQREHTTYAISADGLYVAYESKYGQITVKQTETGEESILTYDSRNTVDSATIQALGFDRNNNLFFTSAGSTSSSNTLNKINIKYGDTPILGPVEVIDQGQPGSLGVLSSPGDLDNPDLAQGRGLSTGGGSPASNYRFQVGPDKGMDVQFKTVDVDIVSLGISKNDVLSIETAQEAIGNLQNAIDRISNERALVGAEVSRLNFTLNGNAVFADNMKQAESRLRDVDFASETARMAKEQILMQSSLQMLRSFNTTEQLVLMLLQ